MDLKDKHKTIGEFGKIPPQAIEIESHILGTLIMYSQQIPIALEYLKTESFYKDAHQKIFQAIYSLSIANKNTDLLTVSEQLRKDESLDLAGGTPYLSQLVNSVVSYANLEEHCQIVAEKAIKRDLIRIGNELIKKSFDESEDFSDIIDFNNSELIKITSQFSTNSFERIDSAIYKKIKEIEHISGQKTALLGIPTNISLIDNKTCGWQSPDLIIIAARPSVGKTAFALKIAKESALAGYPCVFFSMEMSTGQLALRLISGETNYTQMELKTGRVNNWSRIETGIKKFDNLLFFVDDKAALSISQIKSRLISYKQKYNIKLAVIDYLQLMRGFGSERNREAEVANISKSLKTLAKELEIPIIALCQLNRSVEARADKKPLMMDLRESGQIEQDADMIIFLRRDEIYSQEPQFKQKIQLDIAKYRNGAVGELELNYNTGMTDFFEESDFNIPSNDSFYEKNEPVF